jgi:hypothetical protein
VFCTDGAIHIDNNIGGLRMKRVVLNRQNSPVIRNPRSGGTAVILASLTGAWRRRNIAPNSISYSC